MKFKTTILIGFAALAAVAVSGFRFASPEIGGPAPAFSLPSATGKTVNLSDYKGKYVVLEWTNQGCPFVKKHYGSGNMQATQKWAADKGVVWLTIISSAPGEQGYLTGPEGVQLLKEKKMASTALLVDADGKVGHLYGAKTTPHMFIINPKGELIYQGGMDNKPTTNLDDVPVATNYVKQALEEAMNGKAVSNPSTRPYGCSIKYKD